MNALKNLSRNFDRPPGLLGTAQAFACCLVRPRANSVISRSNCPLTWGSYLKLLSSAASVGGEGSRGSRVVLYAEYAALVGLADDVRFPFLRPALEGVGGMGWPVSWQMSWRLGVSLGTS